MAIGVPQIEEQEKIGRIVATIDKKNDLESNRKGKLEELFRTLLHQLMTGQVRVNDLDIDSPSPFRERVGVRDLLPNGEKEFLR
jgi:type I restriction enzyme S subunit